MTMRRSLLLAAPLCLLALAACQRRGEPVPTLTQEQWARVQENFLKTAPVPQHPVGAVFGDKFRLIGWEMSLIWECLAEVDTNWRIFAHLDGSTRQNLDHDAMANAFPTLHWKKGTILKDTIETKLATGGDGEVKLFVGFYHDEERLEVSVPGSGKVKVFSAVGMAVWSFLSKLFLRLATISFFRQRYDVICGHTTWLCPWPVLVMKRKDSLTVFLF